MGLWDNLKDAAARSAERKLDAYEKKVNKAEKSGRFDQDKIDNARDKISKYRDVASAMRKPK